MPIIGRNNRFVSNALWRVLALIILLLFTAGCAATTRSILKNVETIEICLNGKCGMASGRFTKDELIGGLLMMLKANENSEAVLCSSDDNFRECKQDSIR
jgi:hypothetical protein